MQRCWMARFVASALALVTVFDGLGRAANAGGTAPKPPDLSGTWVSDMGEVQFIQAGTSATAIFSNGGGNCKNGDHLSVTSTATSRTQAIWPARLSSAPPPRC